MRIAFDEDFDQHIDLVALKKYHCDSLKVCEKIEEQGEDKVREQVINSELLIPIRPKTTLKKLVIDPQKISRKPEKLHSHLQRLLVTDFDSLTPTPPNEQSKTDVYNFLRSSNFIIKKRQAKIFWLSAAFGYFLESYFKNYFMSSDDEKPWHLYIKEHFDVTERYERSLRIVGKIVNQYPKLKKLAITVKDFLKLKTDIEEMLEWDEYRKYWM